MGIVPGHCSMGNGIGSRHAMNQIRSLSFGPELCSVSGCRMIASSVKHGNVTMSVQFVESLLAALILPVQLPLLAHVTNQRLRNRKCSYRGGLGAQNPGPQGDRCKAGRFGVFDFCWIQPTFGSEQDGQWHAR